MSLADAIAEALANATPAPPNEAATCSWVVEPLLKAIGYALREIEPRVRDSNSQFPDYAILPNTSASWYLEAKCWGQDLEDRHAQQALNYANQNGRRWVVLTNGYIWRLYDNGIQGTAPDKLVAEASLDDLGSSEPFLQAISREAVTTGKLERFARLFRLAGVLGPQLRDPNSQAVRALWTLLRRQPGLEALTRADIAEYLTISEASPPRATVASALSDGTASESAAAPASRVLSLATAGSAAPVVTSTPVASGAEPADGEGCSEEWQPLQTLAGRGVTGLKPISFRLPNGDTVRVRSWAQMLTQACKYVLTVTPLLTVPFPDRSGKRVNLISGVRPPSNLRSERIEAADATLFVYVNYDADNCVANAIHILGQAPPGFATTEPAVLIRKRAET